MVRTMVLLAAVTAAAGLIGCGGTSPDGFSPEATTQLSADMVTHRAYLGVTNRVGLAQGIPTQLDIDLVAGARVQLEVAAVDGELLKFRILHKRADGTTELLNPVSSSSGFKLTTLEATSEGRFSLLFPESNGARDVVVWMECESASGRCASKLQPGEACFLGVTCDEGLDCRGSLGECDPLKVTGTCVGRNGLPACGAMPVK